MEIKRALEIIEEEMPFTSGVIEEAMDTIKNAIKKDEPLKPKAYKDTFNDDIYEGCPFCKKPIVNVWNFAKYQPLYCHYCGQRLDWSDNLEC